MRLMHATICAAVGAAIAIDVAAADRPFQVVGTTIAQAIHDRVPPATPPALPTTDLSELPEGNGRDVTMRMCVTQCHPVRVLLNRRSHGLWQSLINLMRYKDGGLEGTPDDIKAVLSYLSRYVGRVNPNVDSKENLQLVLEIPDEAASAIVAYRQEHGAFQTLDDLAHISGLTHELLDARKDRIAFKGPY
jgi:competence protein ComEA